MPFISYAQNYEDVILWRALKDIENGFYIDVGAMDPVLASVTKAFYEAGWRGINIEPVEKWFKKLTSDRHQDINLQVLAGDENIDVDFYEIGDTGFSSINHESISKIAQENNYDLKHSKYPMRTLNSICSEHQVDTIHFLKIDVEEAEYQVLHGFDLKKYRPWIVLIEATVPNSPETNYDKWEPLITKNQYHFVYFDGLNRFYVADEHSNLDAKIALPPNVFDDFILHDKVIADRELAKRKVSLVNSKAITDKYLGLIAAVQSEKANLEIELIRATGELTKLQNDLKIAQEQNERNLSELEAVLNSTSFRITKPMRETAKFFREAPHKLAKPIKDHLFSVFHFLRFLPLVSLIADGLKKRFPKTWTKIRRKLLSIQTRQNIEVSTNYSLTFKETVEDEEYFTTLFEDGFTKR